MNRILLNRFKASHYFYQGKSIFDHPEQIVVLNNEGIEPPQIDKSFLHQHTVNFKEQETVLEVASKLIAEYSITKVVVLSEFDVILGAKIHEQNNSSGMGTDQAKCFIDKLAMKTQLQGCGINIPQFALLTSNEQAHEFFDSYKKVVIKPIDGSGSVNTFIIDSKQQLQTVLEQISKLDRIFEIEQFIDGIMYHCDVLVQHGEIRLFSPSHYILPTTTFSEENFLASICETDEQLRERLLQHTMTCLDTLSANHGIYHLECFLTPEDEIVFCEVAARIPGAAVRPSIHEAFNADITKLLIDIHIDEQPLNEFEMQSPFGQIILFNLKDWETTERAYQQLDHSWICFKQCLASKQSLERTATSSSDASIKYAFYGENKHQLLDRFEQLRSPYKSN